MKQKNQTSNPTSEQKWRKQVLRTPTAPLFSRIKIATEQAKTGLSSKGFGMDLAIIIIECNLLGEKFRKQGLPPKDLKRYYQLKKDIKIAESLQERS